MGPSTTGIWGPSAWQDHLCLSCFWQVPGLREGPDNSLCPLAASWNGDTCPTAVSWLLARAVSRGSWQWDRGHHPGLCFEPAHGAQREHSSGEGAARTCPGTPTRKPGLLPEPASGGVGWPGVAPGRGEGAGGLMRLNRTGDPAELALHCPHQGRK